MDEDTALAAFAALSNKTRLRILKTLVTQGPGGLPAGDIAAAADASPSRTSFHLSHMSGAGLITSKRDARSIRYSVNFTTLGALGHYFLQDCCNNNADVLTCCGLPCR